MTARDYNARVAEIARRVPLAGVRRQAGGGSPQHRWRVTARSFGLAARDRAAVAATGQEPVAALQRIGGGGGFLAGGLAPEIRLWRIDVGSGGVNDTPAMIEYRRTDDPRGWTMPPEYAPWQEMRAVVGDTHPWVDRPMWEEPRPFLLLTAPSRERPQDTGGFSRVPDLRRPLAFRTEAMWERELWEAGVFVGISSWRVDTAQDPPQAPRRLRRWRVVAGRVPPGQTFGSPGIRTGDACELARLYLVRDPRAREPDRLHVQQRVFWDLQWRVLPDVAVPALASVLEVAAANTLAVLPLGAGGLAVGTAALAFEVTAANAYLGALLNQTATTDAEFWN